MCWTSYLGGPNGPTERAHLNSCLMEMDSTVDGGRHLLRTNTLLLRHGMCKRLGYRSYWLGWRGPRFWTHPITPINHS